MYIGLDAGASKTELLAQISSEEPPLSLLGPAANMARVGSTESARILADLIRQACEKFPGEKLESICAGVAGATGPSEQQALANELRDQLGNLTPPHIHVVHDGAIALEAAFMGGSGVIVAAGTGSIVLARSRDGVSLRAGGWGYLLGDEGSGYVIGLHGLRAVATEIDGGDPTRIRTLVREVLRLETQPQIVQAVYRDHLELQHVAPLVLKAAADGDEPARRIIYEQTHALARQVELVTRRGHEIEKRVALLGGLLREPYYREALTAAIHAVLPGWEILQSVHRPVVGALHLSRSLRKKK